MNTPPVDKPLSRRRASYRRMLTSTVFSNDQLRRILPEWPRLSVTDIDYMIQREAKKLRRLLRKKPYTNRRSNG